MILGQYLSSELKLNSKLSDHVIEEDDGIFKVSTTPIVDLGTYELKILNTEEIIPEESFTNGYIEEVYELEHVRTATKLLRVILYAKHEKADLHKVMKTKCKHLAITKCNELPKLLHTKT